MALFHLSVTQTKRSAGQSAIASAAYRAGERLYSEYYGEYSDYTRKGGVICSDILLPSYAPPEYADRQTLWNAVEKAECGKNAQLAYSFDIALQNEFSLEENIALARQFLLENFVSRGMVVDFAVHQPDREDGGIPNPHFHVLCPITEEKTVQIPMYKPVVVFDVQQTAGKPLPKLAANLTGDVQNYEVFMEALRRSAPVPICFEKLAENMDGYFSVDKQLIAVREGMSEVQTVCAAVHEIAHSKLHNKDEIGEKYQAVELFGKPALFSNGRIDRDKLPEGLYAYDLRGSDYDEFYQR